MRARLEITPLGAAALALFHISSGAALLTGDRTAQLAASLLFAPIAIDVVEKVRRRPRFDLHAAPARAEARRAFQDRFSVRNGPVTLFGLQLRSDKSAGANRETRLERLGSREELEVRIPCRGMRRGRYDQREVEFRTGHPLGLWRWRATPRLHSVLIVEPAREPLPPHATAALEGDRARHRPNRGGDPEVFHSLRELRVGEDARRVHALRSATLGKPVARVDHGLTDDRWTIVLDLRQPPGALNSSRRRDFERQLGRVARLVDTAVERRIALGLTIIDDTITEYAIERPGSARRALERLATVQPVGYRRIDEQELPLDRVGGSLWISASGCSDTTVRTALDRHGFVEVEA